MPVILKGLTATGEWVLRTDLLIAAFSRLREKEKLQPMGHDVR